MTHVPFGTRTQSGLFGQPWLSHGPSTSKECEIHVTLTVNRIIGDWIQAGDPTIYGRITGKAQCRCKGNVSDNFGSMTKIRCVPDPGGLPPHQTMGPVTFEIDIPSPTGSCPEDCNGFKIYIQQGLRLGSNTDVNRIGEANTAGSGPLMSNHRHQSCLQGTGNRVETAAQIACLRRLPMTGGEITPKDDKKKINEDLAFVVLKDEAIRFAKELKCGSSPAEQ